MHKTIKTGTIPDDSLMPPGWNKTHEDLMTEMKNGKRASIGRAEMDWATQYEQGLLPSNIRFPRVGEIYEVAHDIDVQFEMYFAAPLTNSGSGRLLTGERVRITLISPQHRPIWAFARPLQYRTIEERFVQKEQRKPPYSHFSIILKTMELHSCFRLVDKWTVFNLKLIVADACRRR
ncbi:MAG: hypothetical protein HZB31_13080 [Nitrospirae bacterium]|nr:hypothetical protein [Nitrospirota bacterium]